MNEEKFPNTRKPSHQQVGGGGVGISENNKTRRKINK